jgi:GTP:adenosylcobinamide-phosphate guanylyltransferase
VNRFDPHGRIFMNVNTPADLELAEEIARGEDQSPDNAGGVIPDQTGK